MNTNSEKLTKTDVSLILENFVLPPQLSVREMTAIGGGTKNQNFQIQTNQGNYFLRIRHQAFSDVRAIQFDHELMQHLNRKKISVPNPVATTIGSTWLRWQDEIIELFPFIEAGETFRQMNQAQLYQAGKALGKFHQSTADFTPTVSKPPFRIDPPDKAEARVLQLMQNRNQATEQQLAAYVLGQLESVKKRLPDGIFWNLPCQIIHGDFHPGNVKFKGARVAGFFDLDWASRQPRLFDLAYGLLYFAALRSGEIDGGDIYSLTQTCLPSISRSLTFIDGYLESVALEPREIDFIPDFMQISWICCRTDGSYKVPKKDSWQFFSQDIDEPLNWLDQNKLNLIDAIKERL